MQFVCALKTAGQRAGEGYHLCSDLTGSDKKEPEAEIFLETGIFFHISELIKSTRDVGKESMIMYTYNDGTCSSNTLMLQYDTSARKDLLVHMGCPSSVISKADIIFCK